MSTTSSDADPTRTVSPCSRNRRTIPQAAFFASTVAVFPPRPKKLRSRGTRVAMWRPSQPGSRPVHSLNDQQALDRYDEIERVATIKLVPKIAPHPGFVSGKVNAQKVAGLTVDAPDAPFITLPAAIGE